MLRLAQDSLTFDDVLLLPGYSEVLPKNVDLSTQLTRDIRLRIPLLSAAMDTVTSGRLAIALAQEGGIGIVHKNMTPEQQGAEVRKVKKFETGVIKDPITVTPDTTVAQVEQITYENRISGLPVVQGEELVGIVTRRDIRFETDLNKRVSELMTGKDKLVTVREGAETAEIMSLLHRYRIEKVLVVNDKFQLRGLITLKDIQKAEDFPYAAKDGQGQLRVGAAVGTGGDTEERLSHLVKAGVDVVIVDTAHGHSKGVLDRVRWIKKHYPELQIIGGNIATADAAIALAAAGADGVKVGIGPGSICTTRIVAGIGVPQITAVANVAAAMAKQRIPVIADGGIRFSGDIAKAIAAGASSVMVGGLLAGTDEAPGEIVLYQGRSYKAYRGMGSLGAMSMSEGSSDRYFQDISSGVEKLVPEGIEGRVASKGPLSNVIVQLMGGLRSSMGYTGCADIHAMRTVPQFTRITSAGISESHVHDVTITKEAPNYRVS